MRDVRSATLGFVSRALRVPAQELQDGRALRELGVDSVDLVELVLCLEELLGVRIPDERVLGVQTVGELVRAVSDARRAPRAQ